MKFSITIPSYKSRYLKESIDSIVAQTFEDWELIVVDDCSPEDLHAVVAPYLEDSRIHYYRNSKNCGAVNVVDNWNICLQYCTGDYVICIGDDDKLSPCCLKEYSELINKYPGLGVYHARSEIIDEKSNVIGYQEKRPEWESAISLLWNRWDNRKDQYIGDFCYDCTMLRNAGGYYKLPLAWGSDDVTAVRAAAGKGIANTQTFCFQYRQNRYTITQSNNARIKLEASLKAHQWFSNFLEEVEPKSESDKNYMQTINNVCYKYYYMSLGKNCADDLHGNPLRIPFWMKKMSCFDFPVYLYIKWYIKSIYNLFVKK